MSGLQQTFTVRVRLILFCAGHVLAVRDRTTDHWFLPGGGLEHGESTLSCLRREIAEECDLPLPEELRFFGLLENRYQWESRDIHEMLIHFTGRLEGAAPPAIAEREAHLDFQWLPMASFRETVIWPPESHDMISAAWRAPDMAQYAPLAGGMPS